MIGYNPSDRNDTIVALATPPGKGAIAIIRISGKECISLVSGVFKGKDLSVVPGHTIHFGTIQHNGKFIDDVLVSIFREPNSYTGENVVEVSCHGSGYIIRELLQLFILHGARHARPGEFTMRAFLNGKLDLVQAEAVADLIASESETAHMAAIKQMRGGFSGELKILRDQLLNFASLIELELDFSEEDVEFASRAELKNLMLELKVKTGKLLSSFGIGNVIKNGVPTVIAGKPNSGKSTLLNALLNEEKAIVSEIEGTTRDFIEDEIHIEGITFRFIDTAGIREARDRIEEIGIERTRQKMKEASLIIYLFDLKNETFEGIKHQLHELDLLGIPYFKVGNKLDDASPSLLDTLKEYNDFIFISAKKKENLETLKKHLVEMLDIGEIKSGDVIVTNARHYENLKNAQGAIETAITNLDKKISGEFLAMDIRQALHYLGEITGEITTDDLLANIFSKFCIGK